MTADLRTAIEALLAAPRSLDSHGYLHYVDPDLLNAVAIAYRAELRKHSNGSSPLSRKNRRRKLFQDQ